MRLLEMTEADEVAVEPGSSRVAAGSSRGITQLVPAGFWRRIGAAFVDTILLAGVLVMLSMVILVVTVVGMTVAAPQAARIYLPAAQMLIVVVILQLVLSWLYSAVLMSSASRGTLGKRLAGLEVTDLNGGRVSFARATVRFAAKRLAPLTLYFGFFMCAVSGRRQCLHDLIAGTLVVRRESSADGRVRTTNGFDPVEIRRLLDGVCAISKDQLPPDLHARVTEIRQRILELLPDAGGFPMGSRDFFVLQRICRDYLPTSIAAYLALPQHYATTGVLGGGRTALAMLREQLDLLHSKTGEIAETVRSRDSDRLQAQGRFLEESFGRRSDDLTIPPTMR